MVRHVNVASAVCVCVVLHLDIMLPSFQRFCVFCFPDVPRCCHRNNTICIIDVSVFEQKKQFVLHVTTHALSLLPFSCLLSFSGRCINDVLFRVVKLLC